MNLPIGLLENPISWIIIFLIVVGLVILSAINTPKRGWNVLAEKFRAGMKPDGAKITQITGVMNGRKLYPKGLLALISEEGIYLTTGFPYAWTHPPLFMKWSEMTGYKENRVGEVGFNLQATVCYADKKLELELPIKLSDEFKEKAGIQLMA
ncbi:MAG: hypothetical protein K1X66_06665 [Verrucomicrobiae bacterium]|nr:hypothetical protein [Verrucomicrobiae bacterium]